MKYIKFVPGKKYPENRDNKELWEITDNANDFEDCGVMLDKDIVVVDIDDLDRTQIDALIKTFDISTQYCYTDRGVHFYYKKPKGYRYKARGVNLLGFGIEHKRDFITHKIDGRVVRELRNFDEIHELPWFFKIMKSQESLLGLGDGERYDRLVNLSFKLDGNPDKVKAINFVNDYIFAEKMGDKNLNTVLNCKSDSSKKSESLSTNVDIGRDIAKNTFSVIFQDVLYCSIDGNFTSNKRIIRQYINENYSSYIMSARDVTEIVKSIEDWSKLLIGYREYHVQFANGILNNGNFFETRTFTDFTPYSIPREYKPDAYNESMDKLLDILSNDDPTFRQYLIEMGAWSLITNTGLRKKHPRIHFLLGDGGNGKSLFMSLIRRAYGEEVCGSANLLRLNDRHELNSMFGKLCNLSEDVENKPIGVELVKPIKNITALDSITTREMYESSKSNTIISAHMICSTNHQLPIHERGKSIERRFIWIPLDRQLGELLTDEEFDEINSEEAVDYLLKLFVEASMKLYKDKEFTYCERIEKYSDGILNDDDLLGQYIRDLNPLDVVDNKPRTIYEQFQAFFFDEMGEECPIKQTTFTKEIKNNFGVDNKSVKRDGVSVRLFRPDETTTKGMKLKKMLDNNRK